MSESENSVIGSTSFTSPRRHHSRKPNLIHTPSITPRLAVIGGTGAREIPIVRFLVQSRTYTVGTLTQYTSNPRFQQRQTSRPVEAIISTFVSGLTHARHSEHPGVHLSTSTDSTQTRRSRCSGLSEHMSIPLRRASGSSSATTWRLQPRDGAIASAFTKVVGRPASYASTNAKRVLQDAFPRVQREPATVVAIQENFEEFPTVERHSTRNEGVARRDSEVIDNWKRIRNADAWFAREEKAQLENMAYILIFPAVFRVYYPTPDP
ncbi:hypothetical protein F4779DRAFT_614933 [Xylariaceae sp. FL0662B]|nr:hypothetical protein F4779DRAFT_614933 [Xylariaceae sp. FL0662B]